MCFSVFGLWCLVFRSWGLLGGSGFIVVCGVCCFSCGFGCVFLFVWCWGFAFWVSDLFYMWFFCSLWSLDGRGGLWGFWVFLFDGFLFCMVSLYVLFYGFLVFVVVYVCISFSLGLLRVQMMVGFEARGLALVEFLWVFLIFFFVWLFVYVLLRF